MSNTTDKTPDSPPETPSKGRVGLSSDDLLAFYKEVIGEDYEQGRVQRFVDITKHELPHIGIRCTNDQAILIKRLVGNIPTNKFKDYGFSDEETVELSSMYDTI